MWTLETRNDSVLGIGRRMGEELSIALFNFYDRKQEIELLAEEVLAGNEFRNLITGERVDLTKPVALERHSFLWAKRRT